MLYRFDGFEIDTGKFELRRNGGVVAIEPLVFDFICFLAENAGRVVSKEEIVDTVWKGRLVSETTISSCVKSARKALGDSGDHQKYIRTVRGRGFEFLAQLNDHSEKAEQQHNSGNAAQVSDEIADQNSGFTGLGDSTGNVPKVAITDKPPGQGALPPTDVPVIAVLPFNNLSVGVDEYFADGLTEDIIANLARFSELRVVSRVSMFQFKGGSIDLSVVRERLKAGYVVEGSVRRAAGRVRISAQLIDAENGVHLWAETYDRDMEDIFAVQDEVTRMIAAALGVKIQTVAQLRAMRKSPAELDAYDCVLRARRYTAVLSEELHAEARDLLEQAVARDPDYAEAHALLANVYLAEHRFDANHLPDSIDRALAMAQKATRLDPQNAYARCWLGIVHFFRLENDKFLAEIERALSLNPNDPETLADIGHYLAFMGEFDRGYELSMHARQLCPIHPGWYYFSAVRYHYNRRDYEAMLADIEKVAMPHFYWTQMLSAAALGQLDRQSEAEQCLQRAYALHPNLSPKAELTKWNAAPADLEHLLEGLKKAGLSE
ncbi:MAG: winged helix-turn-helix domain-containing protein [Stappiaceae bacterium]